MSKDKTDVDDTTEAAKAAEEAEEAKGEEVIEETPVSDEVVDESLDTDGEEEALEEPGGEAEVEEKVPKGVQKRLDKMTREKYEERAKTEAVRKELEELKKRDEAVAAKEEPPKREEYEEYEDYVADKAAFSAKQAVRDEMRVDAEKKVASERQATLEKSFAAHEGRVKTFKEKITDFEEIAYGDHILPIMRGAPHLAQLVVQSDQGPQIAYHLGSNPEVAEKIAAMPMHLAAKEIGKIEARLETVPKPKNQSKAPEPIKPVKGKDAGVVERSPEGMSMEEYKRWRDKG